MAFVDEIIRAGYEGIQSAYAIIESIAAVASDLLQPILSFAWALIKNLATLGYNLLQIVWGNILQPICSFAWSGIKRLAKFGYNFLQPIYSFAWRKITYLAQLGLNLLDLLWAHGLASVVEFAVNNLVQSSRTIWDNIVYPILDTAGDALLYLYITFIDPFTPYIYRFVVNSINLIDKTLNFAFDGLNVVAKVALAIIGFPLFVVKKCTQNNDAAAANTGNVLVDPHADQTAAFVPPRREVVGAPILNALGNQQQVEFVTPPDVTVADVDRTQIPEPQRSSLTIS